IIEEVEVLNGIATQFLEFARPDDLRREPVQLNRIVQRMLQVMRPDVMAHTATVCFEPGEDLPEVAADGQQLGQVVRNLLLNALQATGDGGEIFLRTFWSPEDGCVVLAIIDNGEGVADEDADRIFEPLYPTRWTGTGL